MKNKRKVLKIITEKLKGMPWAIFSGTAVEIYTKSKRMGYDIFKLLYYDIIILL